jgi:phosphoheptose isomerase
MAAAIRAAHERQMQVVALTGLDDGEAEIAPGPMHVDIRTPAGEPALVLENHRLVLHCLCDLIDLQLMGG